ncbi:MAG: alpha/beta hydrolase [Desulfarculus sp.]|jgi:pimeloyl-ACP methyl ester carboxylesterase|nr:MAG: alpha/beta hydrolase [Desulfarculus sp.]
MRQDHFVNLGDGRFHYIDWGGSGPLLHLGHATGFCAGAYTPLARRLRQSFQVVGLDDRGHGQSTAPADPRRIKDWMAFARDLKAFFQTLGRPVIAAGHSRAGVASLLVAARWPELVRALILIDPTILPFSWMWWWYLAKKTGASRLVPIALRAARRRNLWASRADMLASYQGKGPFPAWQEGFLEAYVNEGSRLRADDRVELCCDPAWESAVFANCSHDIWRYVARVRCPTLVLYGQRSDTFLPAAVRRFSRLNPQAQMLGLERTSHFVPMERPQETAAAITAFVERLGLLT